LEKRAEYLIYKYTHDWFIQLRLLSRTDLDEALNLPTHNLKEKELIPLLCRLFESGYLVAKTEERKLFTPDRKEIEDALAEPIRGEEGWSREKETFYCYTSAARPEYMKLEDEFGELL